MKGKEIFAEGLSNFKDTLRQDVVAFFTEWWHSNPLKTKVGKCFFDKAYGNVGILITIETNVKRTIDSYCELIKDGDKYTKKDGDGRYWEFAIFLNLLNCYLLTGKNFDMVVSVLEHEVTHISQKLNKSANNMRYDSKIKQWITAPERSHSDMPTEKEANLVTLFSLIASNQLDWAVKHFTDRIPYWENIGFNYKTFLKKAADYGLNNSQIVSFLKELKKKATNLKITMLEK